MERYEMGILQVSPEDALAAPEDVADWSQSSEQNQEDFQLREF